MIVDGAAFVKPAQTRHHRRMFSLASRANWGSVPDWIAGVGSVLAFAGFAAAFIWEIRKRRQDDEQDTEDRREALKRHARLVFIKNYPGSTTQRRLAIHNEGTGPILDVVTTVWVHIAESKEGLRNVPTQPSGRDVTTLGAGESGTVWLTLAEGEEIPNGEEYFPQIEFTDCDGGRWRRRDNDQPIRVADTDTGVLPGATPRGLRFLRLMLVVSMLTASAAVVLSIIAL